MHHELNFAWHYCDGSRKRKWASQVHAMLFAIEPLETSLARSDNMGKI